MNNSEETQLRKALYLDDVRTPTDTLPGYEPWVVVRTHEQFTAYIKEHGVPDFISFDHDLAHEHMQDYYDQVKSYGFQTPSYHNFKEQTGLSSAMWLIEHCIENEVAPKQCAVHSHNPVGAKNIQECINNYKKHLGLPQDCYLGRVPFKIEEIKLEKK